jgi:hypothetical protein
MGDRLSEKDNRAGNEECVTSVRIHRRQCYAKVPQTYQLPHDL